jgi:hypothetical protein
MFKQKTKKFFFLPQYRTQATRPARKLKRIFKKAEKALTFFNLYAMILEHEVNSGAK